MNILSKAENVTLLAIINQLYKRLLSRLNSRVYKINLKEKSVQLKWIPNFFYLFCNKLFELLQYERRKGKIF